jgi:hypothetical protein
MMTNNKHQSSTATVILSLYRLIYITAAAFIGTIAIAMWSLRNNSKASLAPLLIHHNTSSTAQQQTASATEVALQLLTLSKQ